jgi:thioredoxin 1
VVRVLPNGQSIISSELALYPNIRHIKIEDGKGRVLGRSFTVKLWSTFIFMKDGVELKRLVRQFTSEEIGSALNLIAD